jgi:hypothetical protein
MDGHKVELEGGKLQYEGKPEEFRDKRMIHKLQIF